MIKVLVGGCFDLIHYGHISFLKQAKKLGDYLIVLLESDQRIKKLKGDSRPIHNQNQRREILESLKFVDKVILTSDDMSDNDYIEIVKSVSPQIIAIEKGKNTKTHAELVNAEVIEIDRVGDFSTTSILQGDSQPSS